MTSQEGAQEPRKGPSVGSKAAHTAERLSASQALSMALTPSPPPPPPYATVVGVDAHRHVTIDVRVVELRACLQSHVESDEPGKPGPSRVCKRSLEPYNAPIEQPTAGFLSIADRL